MDAFPTIAQKPDAEGWSEGLSEDYTSRSPKASGLVKTGCLVTWIPKVWGFQYTQLSNTYKELIVAHEVAMKGGVVIFTWTHPVTAVVYQVRFKGLVQYDRERDHTGTWTVKMTLEQATTILA